jgi:hypothetical protein
MLNTKELGSILIITLILSIALSIFKSINIFLITLLSVFLVLLINTTAKKISAFYLDSEAEIDIWRKTRTGIIYFMNFLPFSSKHPNHKYKEPLPLGIIVPLITGIFSVGYFVWMACLTFEVKPKTYRSAGRYGLYKFSEMTEFQIALIASFGIIANLSMAIIGYLVGFEEFARINIYLSFFNILPLSNLDGNKIFFGSTILWAFLATITIVALGMVFFIA